METYPKHWLFPSFVIKFDRFARIHFIGFTLMWPYFGAIATDPDVSVEILVGIGLIGLSFHLFGGLLNDLNDLHIDKTSPDRQFDPMVLGILSEKTVIKIIAVQPFLMLLMTGLMLASVQSYVFLISGLILVSLYNRFNKVCPIPLLTDLLQGVCWASMTLFGASLTGIEANGLTFSIAATGIGFTLIMNSIHGGLRDIRNDAIHDAKTSIRLMGVEVKDAETVIPKSVRFVSYVFLLLLSLVSFYLVFESNLPSTLFTFFAFSVIAFNIASYLMLPLVLSPEHPQWKLLMRIHLGVILGPVFLIMLLISSAPLAIYLFTVIFIPLLLIW